MSSDWVESDIEKIYKNPPRKFWDPKTNKSRASIFSKYAIHNDPKPYYLPFVVPRKYESVFNQEQGLDWAPKAQDISKNRCL